MALSDLAKRNIEAFGVQPRCASCDFWGMLPYEGHWRGECRINDFITHANMACDEWELD